MCRNISVLIKPRHLCRGKAQGDLLVDRLNELRPWYTGVNYVQKIELVNYVKDTLVFCFVLFNDVSQSIVME